MSNMNQYLHFLDMEFSDNNILSSLFGVNDINIQILERINNDYLFEVKNKNGHKVLLDNGSKTSGIVEGVSPMELLLMGVAGCSSIDIISILNKQKINPLSLKMEVNGLIEF